MAKGQEQTDENRKWPWDWRKGKEALTDTASEEIVKNLACYANDAVYRKPEEVGMSDSLDVGFLNYCFHVKENFTKAAKKYPKSKVPEIAEEAFRLIDRLVSIVEYPTKDNTCSWLELISRWETVVLNFNVCMSSGEQQEKSAEAEQNTTPAKRWDIWTSVKKIPRWIYYIVGFLAALLTCIYLLWLLWTNFLPK